MELMFGNQSLSNERDLDRECSKQAVLYSDFLPKFTYSYVESSMICMSIHDLSGDS